MEYEEPMDINETEEGYSEEGEISSSSEEKGISVNISSNASGSFAGNSYKDKADGFVTGLNVFDKSEAQKKLNRAKRFSLPLQTEESADVQKEKMFDLYRDLRIDKENERHYRFNAIHMRGTENMSTEDVLQYFIAFAPSHVEWINDVSCNVVWTDDVSAARALLNLSKKVKNLEKVHLNADPFEKELKNNNLEYVDSDEAVDAREIKAAIPPGFWRIGAPCKKSSSLLLRFATRSDKKQKNAEKSSEYYKKYGNPHFGNIPGLISNSLRTGLRKSKIKRSDANFFWERFPVEGLQKKNPWEELAYEWGKTDKIEEPDHKIIRSYNRDRENTIPDLRISLKNKKDRHKRMRKASEISLGISDKGAWESKSKIPRMKMYADVEEEKLEKNLKKKMQSQQLKGRLGEDLRSKISKNKSGVRFNFRIAKKPQTEHSRERKQFSDTESDYDDGDSGDWALEHYYDLRESLQQSKRQEHKSFSAVKYVSDSDHDDDDDDVDVDVDVDDDVINDSDNDDDGGGDENDVNVYERDLNRRSPLQIEIENDEYYLTKQPKAKEQ